MSLTYVKVDKRRVWHAIRRALITCGFLAVIILLLNYTPNFVNETIAGTNLILNNNNITKKLNSEIITEDEIFYIEESDIKAFLDEYLIEEDGWIICTSNTNTAKLPIDGNQMYLNGQYIDLSEPIIQRDGLYFLPITVLSEIYNFTYSYNTENETISVDTETRKYVEATVSGEQDVRSGSTIVSRVLTTVGDGEKVSIVQDNVRNKDVVTNGWTKIRTTSGYLGYVPEDSLKLRTVIRENANYNNIDGKVSILYNYFSPLEPSPESSSTTKGINVVTPSFYNLKSDGTVASNIDETGQKYIKWAKSNDIRIWANVSNTYLNDIDKLSEILSTFDNRAKFIDNIVAKIEADGVDGINIDFENMYKEDKDKFSRLIIELTPRIHALGKNITVETLAPDGSDTWSLCYDRNLIGKVADYIIFHGYDQNTSSSTQAGTVAGADWIELNIKKYLGQEGIDKTKIILAMPFYTRLWSKKDGVLTSSVVNMNDVNIPENATVEWDQSTKQNYVEYTTEDGTLCKMWVEDVKSISAKLDIANKYEIGGVAFWTAGREDSQVWKTVEEKIKAEK